MAAYSQGLRPLSQDTFVCEHTKNERLRILLVDDENSMLDTLSASLKSAGYSLYPASTGEDALRKYQSAHPELILLDLFLPDMDGKDLLRRLRNWTSAPILVMSARDEESEIIACLDSGADDYLTIPFTTGELLARIRAVLRRAFGGAQRDVFTAGELKLDFNRREVFVGHEQVALTATEYHLLNVLARHAGRVRTHHQLIHEVWGSTQYQDAVHLLRVTVSNLRRKLLSDSEHHLLPIITEPGVGYRLRSDSSYASYAQAT
jgi:two-component system, OmpR family, KDP operon response regulator KdpE